METIKVAAIQFCSHFGKTDVNRQNLCKHIEVAAKNGAKIIVAPEACISGYSSWFLTDVWHVKGKNLFAPFLDGHSPQKVAETLSGPSVKKIAKICKKHQVYTLVPFIEKVRKKYYNTSVLISPQGKIVLHYRKLYPWPLTETGWATPGDLELPVFETHFGKLAIIICYDIHFLLPELKQKNVSLVLFPASWVEFSELNWFDSHLSELAKEYQLNIVVANWSVPHEMPWSGYGNSRIVSATGNILAQAFSQVGEEIIYADVNTM